MMQSNEEFENSDERGYTLNHDCLEKIFDNLDTKDLINLVVAGPEMCDVVAERAVRKRMIFFSEWNEIWSSEKVFQEFGARMKFMSIGEQNICRTSCKGSIFNYFLQLLIKYCSEDRLQALSLQFNIAQVDIELLNAAMPFFSNLRQFHYTEIGNVENLSHDMLLNALLQVTTHLETIQLERIQTNGAFWKKSGMDSIRNIALIDSVGFDEVNLKSNCVLECFAWINTNTPNDRLCENVARHCPHLERFIDVLHILPSNYSEFLQRYTYLSEAEHLKYARVTSYNHTGADLISFFTGMAKQNTLEHLSIVFVENPIRNFNSTFYNNNFRNDYFHFTSLKSVEIINHPNCKQWDAILTWFFRSLVNLEEITISGKEEIDPVQMSIFMIASEHLRVLRVNSVPVNLNFMLGCCALCKDSPITTIYINADQAKQINLEDAKEIDYIKIVIV